MQISPIRHIDTFVTIGNVLLWRKWRETAWDLAVQWINMKPNRNKRLVIFASNENLIQASWETDIEKLNGIWITQTIDWHDMEIFFWTSDFIKFKVGTYSFEYR